MWCKKCLRNSKCERFYDDDMKNEEKWVEYMETVADQIKEIDEFEIKNRKVRGGWTRIMNEWRYPNGWGATQYGRARIDFLNCSPGSFPANMVFKYSLFHFPLINLKIDL